MLNVTSTIISYAGKTTSKNKGIDFALARTIYTSRTPLSITKNKYLQKEFKLIRPS